VFSILTELYEAEIRNKERQHTSLLLIKLIRNVEMCNFASIIINYTPYQKMFQMEVVDCKKSLFCIMYLFFV
jgi:hypothetical protein